MPRPKPFHILAAALLLFPLTAWATEYPDEIPHRWNITTHQFFRQFLTYFAIFASPPILVSLFFRRELRKTRAYQRSLAEVLVATILYAILAMLWSIFIPVGPHPLLPDNLGAGYGWLLGSSLGLALLTLPATPLALARTSRLLRSLHPFSSHKRGFEPILPPPQPPPNPDE